MTLFDDEAEIRGTVKSVVYEDNTTKFRVLKILDRDGQSFTAVGKTPKVGEGQDVKLSGTWETHQKYGLQLQIQDCTTKPPTTETGIKRYLASDLIAGIGPKLAQRIIAEFGTETLAILNRTPEKLQQISGIGPTKIEKVKESWTNHQQIRDVMIELQSHGISTNYGLKIHKEYGKDAPAVVKNNPYLLARDIQGIGFKIADRIAQETGVKKDDPGRIKAGFIYILNEAIDEGNLFLAKEELIEETAELIELAPEQILPYLNQLLREGRLASEADLSLDFQPIYLSWVYQAENNLAYRISEFEHCTETWGNLKQIVSSTFSYLEDQKDLSLNEAQRRAVQKASEGRVVVITGGPGTGKTTTIKGIIETFERLDRDLALCAPTGRAAKRLSQSTDRQAQTIHRLLGYRPPDLFKYGEGNQLQVDGVVVDEVSMVDLLLMNNLMDAIPAIATLVLVGDPDQLPPVGAGSVLPDLIDSEICEVVELEKIYRQAQESTIVSNAHQIKQGNWPQLSEGRSQDFWFIERTDPAKSAETITELVSSEIPRTTNYNPKEEIQVLAPSYQGICGVDSLNSMLQNRLNHQPRLSTSSTFDYNFGPGDKVMQLENNYEKEVFNGDIGRITTTNKQKKSVKVRYPTGNIVNYNQHELSQLVLAYAITIHKSQGSEYPCIVISLHHQHYVMLKRNLLYTAITRSQELVTIVGTQKALAIAIDNDEENRRNSLLNKRLATR